MHITNISVVSIAKIAVTCTLPLKSGNDDITTFLRPLKVHRCWRNRRFQLL